MRYSSRLALGAWALALGISLVRPPAGLVRAGDGGPCDGVTPVPGLDFTLEFVREDLAEPVDVTAPPGDLDRIFVVEQDGTIAIINTSTYARIGTFLNITARVRPNGERGLLGLAFHPDYATNGFFYVYYTRPRGAVCTASPPPGCPVAAQDLDSESVVSRFQVSANPNVADAASELVLLSFCQPYSNHNGGQVRFGPEDGYLYIATGDGGSGGDPCSSGQRTDTFLGKLLRIDVDATDPGKSYAVPPENPFAGAAGVLGEIWALGLRNPWRFAFDPGDAEGSRQGDLYIGDVGQNLYEEIDFAPASSTGGENYEWRRLEGFHSFNGGTALSVGTATAPVVEYPHGSGFLRGNSVTGGVVYRGCALPDLHGAYFFAEYTANWVAYMRLDPTGAITQAPTNVTAQLNAGIIGINGENGVDSISAFGTDGRGEIYICDLGTKLFKLVPTGPTVNTPPTARVATVPSPPVVVMAGGTADILLDGRTSDDGDGGTQGLTYAWEKVSGPAGDLIALPAANSTPIIFAASGEYAYRLTVDDGQEEDTAEVTVTVEPEPPPSYQRGNVNGDTGYDISDGVFIVNHLFLGNPKDVPCRDALDTDNDGILVVTDTIFFLNYLFLGGSVPPEPFPDCGIELDPIDDLGCDEPQCP